MSYPLGSRVALKVSLRPVEGKIAPTIPAGTVGTVINTSGDYPLVDFGGKKPVYVPEKALVMVDTPDGAPSPEDGDQITVGDLFSLVVTLYVENRRLRAHCAPTFGRS